MKPSRLLHCTSIRDEIIEKIIAYKSNINDSGPDFIAPQATTHARFQQSGNVFSNRPERSIASDLNRIIIDFSPEQLDQTDARLESIINDLARPSFLVLEDQVSFHSGSRELPIERINYWIERISPTNSFFQSIHKSVGRIELQNHETHRWFGTGWLASKDIVITNRHIAQAFAESSNSSWSFRRSILGRQIGVEIDFTEEANMRAEDPYRVIDIVHIEESGPDLAFLRVEPNGTRGPNGDGIELATSSASSAGKEILTIGYPRLDSGMPEPRDMVSRVFGQEFNVKRASPGIVMNTHPDKGYLTHDCSTLGGNSGSAVIDLDSGHALALHMGGNFLRENYAISCEFIASRLAPFI